MLDPVNATPAPKRVPWNTGQANRRKAASGNGRIWPVCCRAALDPFRRLLDPKIAWSRTF
jgi:hypothetical protein